MSRLAHAQKVNMTLLAMKTRANLQRLLSLTYNIEQENAELLADMNSQLVNLYDGVYQQLRNKDGIALRTHRQCNIATIKRRAQKFSSKYSALNRAKSKKMPSSIRKRFGQKADRLRKTHEVSLCIRNIAACFRGTQATPPNEKKNQTKFTTSYMCE